jgi:hypothetical protein
MSKETGGITLTKYCEVKCCNCGKTIIIEDWQNEDDAYCSSECRYEAETGNPGEEY